MRTSGFSCQVGGMPPSHASPATRPRPTAPLPYAAGPAPRLASATRPDLRDDESELRDDESQEMTAVVLYDCTLRTWEC